ncbi:hypothetical protein Ssi03_12790 [Sphaerisporangium siamense]|uniref:7-keto-8-aminopelargonate synthetase-like enzyme n=1 Tax=Sphaerisporangium siamense TaxID=795645 RepID=A0A7W7GB13_9ACTN|nr:hypothetical protein [Sphaerisporangium siamense]MBB4702952.1 7-keto-8-aminopelargonate synthetase-like enzyme [Sphaerisporangium siamense]GII83289.1 hypothetical protein Ssi03_12790 [Sphaerisporangium siamense]
MLMSLADIEARMGQVFEDERVDQVNAFITDVTALVETFLRRSFATSAPPAAVKAVACLEVIRYLNTDPGVAADRVGDLSTSYAYAGAVVVLSKEAKDALRPFRSRTGLGSIQLVSRYIPDPVEETP